MLLLGTLVIRRTQKQNWAEENVNCDARPKNLLHPLREFWSMHSPLVLSPNYLAGPLYSCFTQSHGKDQFRKGMALNETALCSRGKF